LHEIRLIKQSEKSVTLLVSEMNGEQLFVQKTLQGQHDDKSRADFEWKGSISRMKSMFSTF
jgi:hypothetical protein